MIHGKPVFPGTSTLDQLERIIQITGWPSDDCMIPSEISRRIEVKALCELVPKATIDALDFMRQMLQFDPNKRSSAASALNHPFLFGFLTGEEPSCSSRVSLVVDDNVKLSPEEYRRLLTQELGQKKNELESRFDAAIKALHFST
jgi:mitogen-activated protein kinase 15